MTLADIEALMATEAEERILSTGSQLYVSVDAEPVLDIAVGCDGADRPVTTETLFAVYCTGKPAFALALSGLVADGEMSFDDRLGDVVSRDLPPELAALTIGSLLDHTAGLHQLDAHTYLGCPPQMVDELVLSTRPPSSWRVGEDVAYGQVAAWHLLGMAVKELAGEPVAHVVRRRVLEPAGVVGDVFVAGMADDEFTAERDRMAVNAYIRGLTVHPILAERTRRFRCLPSSAFGNTASAGGLGRLFEAIDDGLRGKGALADSVPPDLVATLVAEQSRGIDPVMDRECGYGYGFMTGLGDHEFGERVGPDAFGHTAYGGMTGVFCDPSHRLVVAFHFNGRVDADSALGYRRPAFVGSIYRAVLDGA